ncbi:hypothetical protein EDD11_006985 [Mortierella claussenii]|nr:hypothetical protein EDD11_006985 [Mortierella claussenii]
MDPIWHKQQHQDSRRQWLLKNNSAWLEKYASLDLNVIYPISEKIWNPCQWKSLRHPPFTPLFFIQLQEHGARVQELDLVFEINQDSDTFVPFCLNWILELTPHVKSLALHASPAASVSSDTVETILKIVRQHVAGQLYALTLGIGKINKSNAAMFFPTLRSIKKIQLIRCESPIVLDAIIDAQRQYYTGLFSIVTTTASPIDTKPWKQPHNASTAFTATAAADKSRKQIAVNSTFMRLATGGLAKSLERLAIVNNPHLTLTGALDSFEVFKYLTRLNLECCRSIPPEPLENLVIAAPLLTHVWLGDTRINDNVLLALTERPSSRILILELLSVTRCQSLTSIGIRSVLQTCINLMYLDFSSCPLVGLDIFDEPAWGCSQLEVLSVGGIFQENQSNQRESSPQEPKDNIEDGGQQEQEEQQQQQQQQQGQEIASRPKRLGVRKAIKQGRVNMYKQLGRLLELSELDLGGMPFELKLLEVGRSDLKALWKLQCLRLQPMITKITDEEAIWLVTEFRELQELKLGGKSIQPLRLEMLRRINPHIKIELGKRSRIWPLPVIIEPLSMVTEIEMGAGMGSAQSSSMQSQVGDKRGYGQIGNPFVGVEKRRKKLAIVTK